MDILFLVDRLEAAINKGFVIPIGAKRIIDEDDCLDIIDQMRIAIPEEIRQAKRVAQDRDRLLAQAKEEAERTVSLAKEEASRMADVHEVVKAAEDRAMAIQRQAEIDAQATRNGADEYAQQVLLDLQQRLDELTARLSVLEGTVNNGLSVLTEKQASVKVAGSPANPARTKEPANT